MILSVVIPVYNAKAYLKACVESVAAFPIGDKEIILVDDGCTDGSFDEIEEWVNTLPCECKVIHQPNGGVSSARNVGIVEARGEWLWFVDSDDVIDSQVSVNLDAIARANFVITGFVWKENYKECVFGASKGEIPYNLWRCWFRKSIVDHLKLKFIEGRKYAEDQEFILGYLIKGEKNYNLLLTTCPIIDPIYHYTLREGSAMTKVGTKNKQVTDGIKVFFHLLGLLVKYDQITNSSYLRELKRIAKSIFITIKR